ncbi:MAG: pyruvate ferredoxin oxidoreductase subunit gamma [Candidatus Bathyarchaeota archaeon]|nr:pyruvate ferredoxin oxidoreductase subunit gamma [Candidatus Bathyarchaeota archaeon]
MLRGIELLIEVRWHGRGGQGIVTVSRLLAHAALLDGKHVQAFPEFGPERRGAPVTGYTRISDEPIVIHSHIYNPNIVVIVDPTLLGKIDVTRGLVENGTVVANSDKEPKELKKELAVEKAQVYTVNAARIALDILGRPIYNTAMLGALIKTVPLVSMDSLSKVIQERFPGTVGEKNVAVVKRAHEEVHGVE